MKNKWKYEKDTRKIEVFLVETKQTVGSSAVSVTLWDSSHIFI